jgi:hypothetical protein
MEKSQPAQKIKPVNKIAMNIHRLLAIISCFLLFIHTSFSQEKKDGLPISIKVTTSVNVQESSVELSGVSNSLDGEPGEVHIEINTPVGTTDHLTSRADNQTGNYFVKYTPKALGTYNITAYASDKKQSAKTTFEVSADIAVTETFKTFDNAKKKSLATLETALNAAIAPMAEAEDIAKTKAEVQKVKQKIAAFDDSWSKMKEAVKSVQDLAKKHPEIKKIVAPQLGKLGSLVSESNDFLTQMEKNLGTSKANADDECQTLYRVSESCALFSTVMNVASGGILKIAASIFIDKAWPKIAENMKNVSTYSDNDKFVFTQAGKTGLTAMDGLSAIQTKSFGVGMFGDFVQHVSNGLIKNLCAEFKGPVSGDYTLDFKKDGKTYMKYKLIYEGTMYVSCRKDKLKDASMPKLSGYLEGNVTKMEFTDDVWVVEDKSDWDEVKYERIPAPVLPFNTSEKDPGFGAVARGVVPGAFYFPLQAQIVQEKMIIKLMPARSEFTDAFANRTVMVVRAKAKPYNIDGAVFHYPITTARFILTRSMRMDDKSPTVTLDISTKNGDKTIEKGFNRTESPDADTKVDFNLKLKMFKAFDNAKK